MINSKLRYTTSLLMYQYPNLCRYIIYVYIYIPSSPMSGADDGSWETTAALPKMICRVDARRGTIFGRMIEARNWLRRIRVSKWSPGLRGALALLHPLKVIVVLWCTQIAPWRLCPFGPGAKGHGARCSSPSLRFSSSSS